MTIHEPGVKGEEEISDPVMSVCEYDCSGNGFKDAWSLSSSLCVENEFGGDVVSRSSPAEQSVGHGGSRSLDQRAVSNPNHFRYSVVLPLVTHKPVHMSFCWIIFTSFFSSCRFVSLKNQNCTSFCYVHCIYFLNIEKHMTALIM